MNRLQLRFVALALLLGCSDDPTAADWQAACKRELDAEVASLRPLTAYAPPPACELRSWIALDPQIQCQREPRPEVPPSIGPVLDSSDDVLAFLTCTSTPSVDALGVDFATERVLVFVGPPHRAWFGMNEILLDEPIVSPCPVVQGALFCNQTALIASAFVTSSAEAAYSVRQLSCKQPRPACPDPCPDGNCPP